MIISEVFKLGKSLRTRLELDPDLLVIVQEHSVSNGNASISPEINGHQLEVSVAQW